MISTGEVIRIENDNTLSFGDYLSKEKKKVNDFEVDGDLYNVRTYDKATRLEKNGNLLLETVPGACVHSLSMNEKLVTFMLEGFEDTQVTLELLPEKEYKIFIDGVNVGNTKSTLSGKINFSIELSNNLQKVKIEHFK